MIRRVQVLGALFHSRGHSARVALLCGALALSAPAAAFAGRSSRRCLRSMKGYGRRRPVLGLAVFDFA